MWFPSRPLCNNTTRTYLSPLVSQSVWRSFAVDVQPYILLIGTQETLKQNVQKITKKNQAPLPLFFDSPAILDQISNKKQALQHTFALFDTRGLGNKSLYEKAGLMPQSCFLSCYSAQKGRC